MTNKIKEIYTQAQAQTILEHNILLECGKIVITLSKMSFADEDFENEEEAWKSLKTRSYIKSLIIRAREQVYKMIESGMLPEKYKGQKF